ncbi:Flp pilus assembly protein CpaB [Sphingobium sp. DC-2]|uniref:Flp pilus assembly protein CpaB n=1 Tax=Sphingobium sp. DC-2 TaxID=1303256 RepID=UPI0004C38779|nr:Flp pilus assembly protein CpaB [Sphingobium sp. DC-2]
MQLGAKARLMMIAGTLAALLFLALGIRELQRASAASRPPLAAAGAASSAAPAAVLAAAARAIEIGETITPGMIRNMTADPGRHPLVATPAELVGKVATRAIPSGAPIPRDAIGGEAKLAIRVPVGMRAVSIDTTAEIAVAGLVRPGDRVDVQVVYPGADAISGARGAGRSRAQTLLQMVQVLAVGETVVGTQPASSSDPSTPPPPARTVTLALSPGQVSTLSLAKSTGALTLSLRNPVDKAQTATADATSRAPDPAPQTIVAAPVRKVSAPPVRHPSHAIQLVVGDRHETIYSGGEAR